MRVKKAKHLEPRRAQVGHHSPQVVGRDQIAVRIVSPIIRHGQQSKHLLDLAGPATQHPATFGGLRQLPCAPDLSHQRLTQPESQRSAHRWRSLRYLTPVSHPITTTYASGSCRRISKAAATAAPADQPTRYPDVRASRRAVRSAVSVATSATKSGTRGSYRAGGFEVVARCFSPSSPWK